MSGFSTEKQKERFRRLLDAYWSIPELFRGPNISGSFVERALADARDGRALVGYDFIDVSCDKNTVGFQVKVFKKGTPLTWMRARMANKDALVSNSHKSKKDLQILGDSIIDLANKKIEKSFEDKKKLEKIFYARFTVLGDRKIEYTEAPLCTREAQSLFSRKDFTWQWRKVKEGSQEVRSLQGRYKDEDVWLAWHGMTDNQLHFPGERLWLESLFRDSNLDISDHRMTHSFSGKDVDLAELLTFLEEFEMRKD